MAASFSLTEFLIALVGSSGLGAAGTWLANRRKVRADVFETTVSALSNRLERTETRLDHAEAQHDECREALEASRHDRDELRRKIDALLAGPVAGYRPRGPK